MQIIGGILSCKNKLNEDVHMLGVNAMSNLKNDSLSKDVMRLPFKCRFSRLGNTSLPVLKLPFKNPRANNFEVVVIKKKIRQIGKSRFGLCTQSLMKMN